MESKDSASNAMVGQLTRQKANVLGARDGNAEYGAIANGPPTDQYVGSRLWSFNLGFHTCRSSRSQWYQILFKYIRIVSILQYVLPYMDLKIE